MFVTNLHTLLPILGISKLLLGLLMLFLKTKTLNFKGLEYWAYGNMITSFGIILFSFMPHSVPVFVDFTFTSTVNIFDDKISDSTCNADGEKGTGLGLVHCKEFVELNGGRINAVNIPTFGSIFSFTKPKPNEYTGE